MFSVLRKVPSAVRNGTVQLRNRYTYAGKPRQPLSIAETWAHGICFYVGVFTVPAYILTHITTYRGLDKKKEE